MLRYLEPGRAPLDELDGLLGLDRLNGGVDILRLDVTCTSAGGNTAHRSKSATP